MQRTEGEQRAFESAFRQVVDIPEERKPEAILEQVDGLPANQQEGVIADYLGNVENYLGQSLGTGEKFQANINLRQELLRRRPGEKLDPMQESKLENPKDKETMR